MSNSYYQNGRTLIDGDIARAGDVSSEFDRIQSAFDKLPNPRSDGGGFESTVKVAKPNDPSDAANKEYVDSKYQSNADNLQGAVNAKNEAQQAAIESKAAAEQAGLSISSIVSYAETAQASAIASDGYKEESKAYANSAKESADYAGSVKDEFLAGASAVFINDSMPSANTTYSGEKIQQALDERVVGAINQETKRLDVVVGGERVSYALSKDMDYSSIFTDIDVNQDWDISEDTLIAGELYKSSEYNDGDAIQAGEYKDFAMSNPKGRWLYCDGRELLIADFKDLYEAIGFSYGGSVESGKFRIPDRRDYFARTHDATSDRKLGTLQAQDWKTFWLTNTCQNGGCYGHNNMYMGKRMDAYVGNIFTGYWASPAGGTGLKWDESEIRPKNITVFTCIRF